jgi:hypothetical protein
MLSKEQKDTIIYHIRERGVKLDGCKAVKITIHELNDEMKKHKVFAKEVHEAVKEGNANLADRGKEYLANVIDGELPKSDRNAVTSAIAALNAYEPGFKGTSKVEGTISHDIRVITAVPRPNYEIVEPEKKLLDKPSSNMLKSSKKEIRDENGNLVAIQTVEEAIEGEVIKESE